MEARHECANGNPWRHDQKRWPAVGFTLLELVISCAILVSVFAIAAASLARVHRVRSASKARSRLLIQGEEILGFLSDSFAHAAGTNVLYRSQDGSPTLEIVRFEDYPPSATRESVAGSPFRRVSLKLERNADGLFRARRIASSRDTASQTKTTNTTSSISYLLVQDNGTTTRTNAVAKEGFATRLLPAKKGDTILLPITTTSTADRYSTAHGHGGRIEIVPSPDESTNILFATAVFTNIVSSSATRSILKPIAIAWPAPSTREAILVATAHAEAGAVASNALSATAVIWTNPPLASCMLSYTNMPYAESFQTNAVTNAVSETHLSAGIWNAVRVGGTGDFLTISSNDLARGSLLYASATNGARERIDIADYVWDLFAPEIPAGIATNLLSRIPTDPAAEDVFAPALSATNEPPMYVYQRFATSAMGGVGAFDAECDLSAIAASAYSDSPPVVRHEYWRRLLLETQTVITGTNASSSIHFDIAAISEYTLRTPVPASVYPTNSYVYGGSWTNLVKDGTSTDTDVRWTEYVLDEDFDGADLSMAGIWLEKAEGIHESHLRTVTNLSESVASEPLDAWALQTYGDDDGQLFWAPVNSITIKLLAFSNDDGDRLNLVAWVPGKTSAPVCADIHLELLAPEDLKRATAIADENNRAEYVANRILRMDRRALIGTRRRLPE